MAPGRSSITTPSLLRGRHDRKFGFSANGVQPFALPMLPAFHAVDALHQLMRSRIVRRHRRPVRIVRIEHPRTRIRRDRVVLQIPAWVICPMANQAIDLVVSRPAIVRARAASQGRRKKHDRNQDPTARCYTSSAMHLVGISPAKTKHRWPFHPRLMTRPHRTHSPRGPQWRPSRFH